MMLTLSEAWSRYSSEEFAAIFHAFSAGFRAAKEGLDWQPIETAPKNGLSFLVGRGRKGGPGVRIAYYSSFPRAPIFAGTAWQTVGEDFTHWMPLPEPPAAEAQIKLEAA